LPCCKIDLTFLKGRAGRVNEFESYENAKLGDERLSKRLARLLKQLSGKPEASISASCRDPYQAKAVYRFVGNDDVTIDAITKITHDVTIENIVAAKPSVVLIPQDTSGISYNTLRATSGLGSMGSNKDALGLQLHTALALGEGGEVFGLLAQKIWVRPPEDHGQSDSTRAKMPIEEKESYKWLETMEKADGPFPEGTKVVHVCDREGDIFELFCKAEGMNANYLCRKTYNRNIEEEDGLKKLDDFVDALPEAGRVTIRVPRDSHTDRKERDAEVVVKYGRCQVKKGHKLAGNKDLPESVGVYVVSLVETSPPPGQERIFWRLLTNVPTTSYEDALTRVQWYTQRWKIETFHRTLKSGCKVEELQSDTAEKLMKLIAIYSIIALQIMLLTYVARTRPNESCEICLTEDEWKVLYRVAKKTKALPEKPPTVYEAVVMIANLGGFLGRKSDGFPGVTVMWRGLSDLYTILDAAQFLV